VSQAAELSITDGDEERERVLECEKASIAVPDGVASVGVLRTQTKT
jgi:hypothetical protein